MKLSSSLSNGLVTALVLSAVTWLALNVRTVPQREVPLSSEATAWLEAMRVECDPNTVGNDYEWSQATQPTERRRMDLLKVLHNLPESAVLEVAGITHNLNDEFGQMRVLAALNREKEKSVLDVCRLMVWSGYPAVRVCAARLLRDLRLPICAEWFTLALQDERVVMNNACGLDVDGKLYPVRLLAELALRELHPTL
jgi:hypothetical protein